MRITNLIKTYPCTIITTFLLIAVMTYILFPERVESASNNECQCIDIVCTTKPPKRLPCNDGNPCTCSLLSYQICDNDKAEKCARPDGGGCCDESNCEHEHDGKGCAKCGNCMYYKTAGCTGDPENGCGYCVFPDETN